MVTVIDPSVLSQAQRHAAAMWTGMSRRSVPRWPSPGAMAVSLDPRTRQTPALTLIDDNLVRLHNTPDARLIISMPPQEGKSQRTSRRFPLWVLTQNPDTRIAIASYEARVARRWGRATRDDITQHGHDLGLKVRDDLSAQHEWQLAGHDGGVYTVGVGGALTGRAVDCISGDMHIECEYGRITADTAFARGITQILAFDHTAGRAVWRRVEASRRLPSREVVEIRTQAGRVLTCTPDHRVHTSGGYVPAGDLRPGETLLVLVDAPRMPMRSDMARQQSGHQESYRAGQPALLLNVLRDRRHRRIAAFTKLLSLRGTSSEIPQDHVLRGLPGSTAGECSCDARLPAMRKVIPSAIDSHGLLLAHVCERRSLGADDRTRKLALQDGNELREMVPVDEAAYSRTRRSSVRGLLAGFFDHIRTLGQDSGEVHAGDTPHQRGRAGQQTSEPDHALHDMSRRAPQVERDTVAVVLRSGARKVDVYDFQVEGTHNFFAEGVLVHNCMVIDDPVKDRAQAESKIYRERVWDWWTDVASTRLAPGAPCVLILTRWHHDDLAARLLATDTGWELLNIPAQADHDPSKGETDPLGREPGEFMISARGRTQEQWEARKAAAGPRTWASLYQGSPSPNQGGVFPTTWTTDPHPIWVTREDGARWVPGADEVIQSWDLAFKDADTSDYVAWGVWARIGTQAHLVDVGHARLDFTATLVKVREITARWPQAVGKLVEDKANGPAVINTLRSEIPGIIPVEPQGSKYSRAVAASPFAHAGNIVLPDPAHTPAVVDLLDEARDFPNGKHDDLVDQLTQAANQLLLHPILTGTGDVLTPQDLFTMTDDPHAYLGGY